MLPEEAGMKGAGPFSVNLLLPEHLAMELGSGGLGWFIPLCMFVVFLAFLFFGGVLLGVL